MVPREMGRQVAGRERAGRQQGCPQRACAQPPMLLACMYCEPKAPILLVLHARTLLLLLPLPTRLCADDTRAILAAVKAASARAAALLAAECGETGCKVGAGRSRAVACRCSGSWGACRPCPWPTLLLPFSACCGLDELKIAGTMCHLFTTAGRLWQRGASGRGGPAASWALCGHPNNRNQAEQRGRAWRRGEHTT